MQFEIFAKQDFKIRGGLINNEPYFVLADICNALNLQTSRVKDRLKEDGVTTSKVIDSLGRDQIATFINEQNLYKVIFQSRKDEAEIFQDWVTGEVLPQIRKTGSYNIQPQFQIPQTLSQALLLASQQAEQIEQQKEIIAIQAPKVEFYDAVTGSKDTIDMGSVAKVLNKKIGRNKLFEFLRENGVLMSNNIPYQKYVDSGHFRVIETKYTKPDGSTHIGLKTLIYQKGVNYINKLLEGVIR
ncbi:MAG: phage antirepressor KilAC domain-containing protein [Gammaproteobacteria bacterium]|nr:phage antirepressor KilAC domain-containing protein [Gammaproteobacteria bacterium]